MTADSQQWLCQQIVDQAQDAIIFADREGIIRLWNAGAAAIFGHSASEALGQSLDLIIPERLQGRHWEGFHRVMATGETRYGRELLSVPAMRKDGARLSVEFSIVLLRDADGGITGIAAILRDVTARWEQERDMRKRLAELEAQPSAAVRPDPSSGGG